MTKKAVAKLPPPVKVWTYQQYVRLMRGESWESIDAAEKAGKEK